ncbi:helix-turn-helix domain-containing protein [Pseudoroseomonas wenyumeiae]|uniref:AraC family transcriptional regulator n=1 Tax=Teichococcus wenyumeiae TaxID=2478470 RepID=A0A3A9J1L6_9PROT|nr:AraC family transcriptional regulator [Pseudoroseomonas wenyumeiae]RKK01107.1 AraC family transcriptional regulator [Pseudoroseomonas wenyumeiae]RMI14526.1 helix-turn-helix domain-containing protein [Pseudoroseomonas wenyumeiae]
MIYAQGAMILSPSSKDAVDPLSELLAVLGVRSIRCTRLEAAGDWSLAFPAQARLKFVAVRRGRCCVLLPGQSAFALATGDVFLVGHSPYTVASSPGVDPVDGMALYAGSDQDVVCLGGHETVMLGGGVAFSSEEAGFLLEALPGFMHVAAGAPSASAVRSILDLMENEVGQSRPGNALITARLAEVLLVEAIRAHIADHGEESCGWIGGLADRRIGKALCLMHGNIAFPWTVGALAAQVGMSRSAFAALFTRRVGRPPLDYLAGWRMTLSRHLLLRNEADVASVAAQVGYASPSAFGHAFKRSFGHSPRKG